MAPMSDRNLNRKRPAYILTTRRHLKANLKHSRYHEKLVLCTFIETHIREKKLLLICVAGVFEESDVPLRVGRYFKSCRLHVPGPLKIRIQEVGYCVF